MSVRGKEGPMRRGAKPTKVKADKSPKDPGPKVRDLEKRLADALEQQTATSEILGVISQSQTDVQPVFDAIVKSAVRLCDASYSAVLHFDGKVLHHVAQYDVNPAHLGELTRLFPIPPTRTLTSG